MKTHTFILSGTLKRGWFLLGSLALAHLTTGAPGDLLWSEMTGDLVFGSPAIGSAGEVVVGSSSTWYNSDGTIQATDGDLLSFNPDGSLRWIFTGASDWIDSSPSIGTDGTVYAGSWDGFLYAVDGHDGSLKWSFETAGFIIASPAIGPDGSLYVASNDGLLYALNPTGTQRWILDSVDSYSPINSSPVLSHDGATVYFGNDEGVCFAVDTTTGTTRWAFDTTVTHPIGTDESATISGSPAIASDGRIIFGSENTYLYALNSDGSLDWYYKAAESIRSSPVISTDGTIHFAAQDGYLYALDSEGFQLSETYVGDVFYCSPAIDALGNVIIAGYAGSTTVGAATRIASIDPSGNLNWEFLISDYNDSSPNIAPDGSIYIGAHDGFLYKFEGAAPLMSGQWPKVQATRRHTGFAADLGQLELIDFFPAITLSIDGWAYVPWFGAGWITDRGVPWIQHIDHGYLYLDAPYQGGLWMYDIGLKDWIYAPVNAPNYFYRYGTNSWLYHITGSNLELGRWFYDFSTAGWFSGVAP
jgi:outer membrane protein assembly factor BamB